MSKLQKIAEGKQALKLNTFNKPDRNPTLPGKETSQYLIFQHFPSATEIKRVRYTHKSISTAGLTDMYEDWISKEKIPVSYTHLTLPTKA